MIEDIVLRKFRYPYPQGILTLFITLMFSMIAFSIVQSSLVLCAIRLHAFSDHQAYLLFATFMALIFVLPTIGGYIGGRYLGYPFLILIGLLLCALGLYTLCFYQLLNFYIGLGLFTVGSAFIVSNIYVLLGRLFNKHDYRRESGFTLVYTGLNLGYCIGAGAAGYIIRAGGYHSVFLIAAVCMLVATSIFILTIKPLLSTKFHQEHKIQRTCVGLLLILLTIPLSILFLFYVEQRIWLLIGFGAITVGIIFSMVKNMPTAQRKRLFIFLMLSCIGVVFWTLYMLGPSVVLVFMERNVSRTLFNHVIPVASFLSLNPFFIIMFGTLFSGLWLVLPRYAQASSVPLKFTLGIALTALAFFALAAGAHWTNAQGKVAIIWVVLFYLLQTVSELLISPTALAMIGTLVPERHEGSMMGIWMLVVGIGSMLSVFLADHTIDNFNHKVSPAITDPTYFHAFIQFGLIAFVTSLMAFLLIPTLKKRNHRLIEHRRDDQY